MRLLAEAIEPMKNGEASRKFWLNARPFSLLILVFVSEKVKIKGRNYDNDITSHGKADASDGDIRRNFVNKNA
jgi:hypothetical protein